MEPGRLVIIGVLLLFVLLSGVWTSRSGRPLNVGASTVHKLVSLAAGGLIVWTIVQRHRTEPLSGTAWAVIVATGLCFAGLVATGGFLSGEKEMPAAVLRAHQVLPGLAILGTAAVLYLVGGW
jgi:hypothetical protein